MQLSSADQVLYRPESRRWLQRMAKVGYAIKGLVYSIVGVLALQVALGGGGRLVGEHEAVEHVGHQPFGTALLVGIGAGLLAYALWRFIEGVLDAHHEGTSGRGIVRRVTCVGSGIVNGAIGILALQLAMGEGGSNHDTKRSVASVMQEPWGLAAVAIGGLIVTIVGVYHLYAGVTDRFTQQLELSVASSKQRAWALWSGRVGFVARGVVFSIVGVALVQAAITTNPREAKGVKEALQHVSAQPFGTALLICVAFGLLAYGVHLITTVPFRRLIG